MRLTIDQAACKHGNKSLVSIEHGGAVVHPHYSQSKSVKGSGCFVFGIKSFFFFRALIGIQNT